MVGEILGGTLFLGTAGVLAKIAAKVPKALEDTQLTVLHIGTHKSVMLPAYGEYTYANKNQEDSEWWLYYGRDEASGYDGYTLTLRGANIHTYAGMEGIYANGDLHIRLVGENTIGWGAPNYPKCAIHFRGDLLISGEGSLKVAAQESAILSEKGDFLLGGREIQLEGQHAILLQEGKGYLEAGTTTLIGNISLSEIVKQDGLKIVAAQDHEGNPLEQPMMGMNGFYARKLPIYYVKVGDTTESPILSPAPGSEVEAGETIQALCPTWGANILYTTDGSDPFQAGKPYEAAIPIQENMTLKLGAQYPGLKHSAVVEAAYFVRRHSLTWQLDGETWGEVYSKVYGEAIERPEAPEREGYTFAGWKNVPETMPAQDITLQGHYTPNRYTFTCQLQGQVYAQDTYLYGSSVKTPASPAKFGYIFSGWGEIPGKMPAHDVLLTGKWTPKRFRFACMLDDQVYAADMYAYESQVKTPASPAKIGYTFSGWGEIPGKMPAHDVTLYGTFHVHYHTLTYFVDGQAIQTQEVAYGTPLTPAWVEEREGYTFSGWSHIPATMPDQDVEVCGNFSPNHYLATWCVDGDVHAQIEISYGEFIPTQAIPQREGHHFSGWEKIPKTMPAHDMIFEGKLTPNRYTLSAWVGDELYARETYVYGTNVKTPASPAKIGYTFSGWEKIPKTMPAHDVEVHGSFTMNHYQITYQVDGSPYQTIRLPYGEAIQPLEVPVQEGYTFSGWSEIPTTMPAHDVEVSGSFTMNQYRLTYQIDEETKWEEIYAYGATVALPQEPKALGKTFQGWSDNIPQTMPAQDVTLQAKWEIIPVNLAVEALWCEKEEAKTGEMVTWNAQAVGGDGKYVYRYHVNKDGKKLSSSEFVGDASFQCKVEEPGVYRVRVYVRDGSGKQVTKISANLVVKKEKSAVAITVNEPLAIESIKADVNSCLVGGMVTWKAHATGGSGEYVYRYHLLKDGVKQEATEFIEADTYAYTPQEPGVYCVRLFVKNKEKKGKQVTKQSGNVKVTK